MRILILTIAVVVVSGQDDVDLDLPTLTAANVNLAESSTAKKCFQIADPNDTALCYPFPPWMQPDPFISDIQGVTVHTVWWTWVKALRKTKTLAASGDSNSIKVLREMPKRFVKEVEDNDLENRLSDQARTLKIKGQWHPDWREYYWQIDCPYKKKWMYSFIHKYYGRCFLMYLWNYHITPYTVCTRDKCLTRCTYLHPHLKNALCKETNYRRYTRWMWCPYITKWCKVWPSLCFKKITFRLPMNCKCWQCWYRKLSFDFAFSSKADVEPQEEADIDDDGPEPPEGFEGDEDGSLGIVI